MAVPSPILGHSPGGAEESSYHCMLPPSPSVLVQPSGSEVGKSSEEHVSIDDVDYCQLLKDYCVVQAVLSVTRLNTEMLCSELDASRDALQAFMTEFSKVRVNWEIFTE